MDLPLDLFRQLLYVDPLVKNSDDKLIHIDHLETSQKIKLASHDCGLTDRVRLGSWPVSKKTMLRHLSILLVQVEKCREK